MVAADRFLMDRYNVTGKMTSEDLAVTMKNEWTFQKGYCSGHVSVIDQAFWDTLLGALEYTNMTLVFGVTYSVGRPEPTNTSWDPGGDEPPPPAPKNASWVPSVSGFDELVSYTARRWPNRVLAFELGK